MVLLISSFNSSRPLTPSIISFKPEFEQVKKLAFDYSMNFRELNQNIRNQIKKSFSSSGRSSPSASITITRSKSSFSHIYFSPAAIHL